MERIQILPETIANQIAAGEVIERPVHVAKELLENSLDAHATQIDIQFCSGGISRIQVHDNGCGMDEASAVLCFQRHATSKLQKIHDLQIIRSFGFRGEALPSIASVAKVTLTTRSEHQELGTMVEISANEKPIQTPYPCPIGTTVTVEQLFYNVPVRRKFLKSEATESAHIIHCVRLYALAYPQVHFTLQQDGRQIFSSPSCSQLEERIQEIWPNRTIVQWLPLQASQNHWTLSGLLCPPGSGCAHHSEMYLFLNQRPIIDALLTNAVQEAYHGFLPNQCDPAAFLFLSMPGTDVDINVHPTKREVRFQQENKVRTFVLESIRSCLEAVQTQPFGIPHDDSLPQRTELPSASHPEKLLSAPAPSMDAWVSPNAERATEPKSEPVEGCAENSLPSTLPTAPTAEGVSPASKEGSKPPPSGPFCLPFLALWNHRLAIFQDDSFLVFLDCKGAQMRLWYDRISALFHQGKIGSLQTLLFPYIFSLEDRTAACFKESIDYVNFREICVVRALTDTQFQIDAIPQWLPTEQIDRFIAQLTNTLEQNGQMLSLAQRFEPLLTQILLHQTFEPIENEKQVRALCEELKQCENYITDPLGHSIWNRFTAEDLMRKNL